jgi:hypothetical protein
MIDHDRLFKELLTTFFWLLSLTQLEDLAEALLDFYTEEDLLAWLQQISDGTHS